VQGCAPRASGQHAQGGYGMRVVVAMGGREVPFRPTTHPPPAAPPPAGASKTPTTAHTKCNTHTFTFGSSSSSPNTNSLGSSMARRTMS
jgi:hypothetical protein